MSTRERFLEPPIAEAIESAQPAAVLPFALVGDALEVDFPGTGVADVAHGLGAVPDGVLTILAVGGMVAAVNVEQWTRERAFLQASAANTRAIVIFVALKEGMVKRA